MNPRPTRQLPEERTASQARRHVRAARAEALFQHLIDFGGGSLDALVDDLVTNGGWTRAQLERAIDDLCDQERATVEGTLGWVDISAVLPVEGVA